MVPLRMSKVGWKIRWWKWIQEKVSLSSLSLFRFQTFFDKINKDSEGIEKHYARDQDEVKWMDLYYPDQVKPFGVDLSAAKSSEETE